MIQIDGFNLNITDELQETLRQNAPKAVKKSVVERKRNDNGDLVSKLDAEGNAVTVDAVIDTHPFVYFDESGRSYFNVFRSMKDPESGVEVLVTNPKIKTKEDCNLYAKGLLWDRKVIPGSELWDNGSDVAMKHTEPIYKGDPTTKIVKTMTAKQVIDVQLKPQGAGLAAQFANASETEKAFLVEQISKELEKKKLIPNTEDIEEKKVEIPKEKEVDEFGFDIDENA